MDEGKHWDSVGWVFWTVMFVIFSGPLIYWSWNQKYESTPLVTPIILGMIGGAILSGVMSAAVNGVLQYRARNRHKVVRKTAKKHKKN
jgi:hypothetical protein